MPNSFYAFDYLSPFLFKLLSVLLEKGKNLHIPAFRVQ